MNPITIDLSNFPDRFDEKSRQLVITKNSNFFFGKNGTGKSTITNTIKTQFDSSTDVCIFNGFEEIVGENHELKAIALGTENVSIQKDIDKITIDINTLLADLEKTDVDNTFSKLEKAKNEYNKENKIISDFYSSAAKRIKITKINQVSIAPPNYNRDYFFGEIQKAKKICDIEIENLQKILKSEKKIVASTIKFPNILLSEYLKKVNDILCSLVSQNVIIEDLENNPEKQNFARTGMRIHNHENGERCAFCGSLITEERWQQLGNYFNQEVKNFEQKIENCISDIKTQITKITSEKKIIANIFCVQFEDRIANLNLKIKNKENEYENFFTQLMDSLDKKKSNLFSQSKILEITCPNNFSDIQAEYDSIVNENNDFSNRLENEQKNAINELRYSEIAKEIETFKYTSKKENLNSLEIVKNGIQADFDLKKSNLDSLILKKNELISKTQDESKISTKINDLLKNIGVTSFSLDLVKNKDENQKGQYQIKGYNNILRSIEELSKGEKNIIAFLYFMFSLEKKLTLGRQHIIVFDDPMSSNDDTMQYLMIGEIQKYLKEIDNDTILLVLTHNCHFYFNVRPFYGNIYNDCGIYHLLSNGKTTTVKKIEKSEQDFCTSYEMLWKELDFLYKQNEPNLMLNACRKICETYMHFTKKSSTVFYGDDIHAKKLFDVNQHALDDLEAEENGRTREQIIEIMKLLFERNNALEHFTNYCNV
jgi:wobble nucleotide-excising tRNase